MTRPSFESKPPMVLYRNGLITLEYDPAADILSLEWPEIMPYTLPDVMEALHTLVDTIRIYDIKKILIDSHRSVVALEEEEHQALMADFARNLLSTRLQRMARIVTSDPIRERRVEKARQEAQSTIAYRNFNDRASALAWLKSDIHP